MQKLASPRIVGVGGVFIDDIVLPSGQTYMGQLGGGVVHALMGAAVWGERPGIVAPIGHNLPVEAGQRLSAALDTRGLVKLAIPQIRAWQLFEEDGSRRELYRVQETDPFINGLQPSQFPAEYDDAAGIYLLQGFEGIKVWRDRLKGLVLWEPLQQVMVKGARDAIGEVLGNYPIDIVSPNLLEAQTVYGEESPEVLVRAILNDGARIAALRMGEAGSMIGDRESGGIHVIPAIPVKTIVDQTGAGNTYCGGLLWGIVSGMELKAAATVGAVSASFCLEQIGVLDPTQIETTERDRRFEQLFRQTLTD